MQVLLAFLVGFLGGGLIVRWILLSAHWRSLHAHERDPEYGPAVRAVLRHLKAHATINLVQVEQMLSIRAMTAQRYLDQMERDHHVKLQGHRGSGALYTL